MSINILNLKPIAPPKTLKAMAYASLKEAILTGSMKPDEIYSEPSLSEMLDISRTPVREALQDLAGEGYVQAIPKRGYQVSAFESEKIEHLYDYRMAIELAIIRQITGKLDDYQIMEIENILRLDHLAAENEDMASFVRRNREFHRYLASVTENNYFIDSVERILELIEWAALEVQNRRNRPRHAVQEHMRVFRALAENDADGACAAMASHLMISKKLARKEVMAGEIDIPFGDG